MVHCLGLMNIEMAPGQVKTIVNKTIVRFSEGRMNCSSHSQLSMKRNKGRIEAVCNMNKPFNKVYKIN